MLLFQTVEDIEMNDGSPEKPYFMSIGLMKVLGKKNLKQNESSAPSNSRKTSRVSPQRKGRPLPIPKNSKV